MRSGLILARELYVDEIWFEEKYKGLFPMRPRFDDVDVKNC